MEKGWFSSLNSLEMLESAIFLGVLSSTIVLAIFCIYQHIRISNQNKKLRLNIADLITIVQRNEWLLSSKEEISILWFNDGIRKTTEILGSLSESTGAPQERADFLAFGRWLEPESVAMLDNSITALHEKGLSFSLAVKTKRGVTLDVNGFRNASYILTRFVSLSQEQESKSNIKLETQCLKAEHETLLNLLKEIHIPCWIRHTNGKLKWVNKAYASVIESKNPESAVEEGKELLGTQARQKIARWCNHNRIFDKNISTVVCGNRRVYSVMEYAGKTSSAGLAVDVSSIEAVRQELEWMSSDHAEIFNRLTTAIARFDSSKKLRFYNEAFRFIWKLDASFLDSEPDHAILLDRLRSEGKISERPEWRLWKDSVLSVYRSLEIQEDWWYLPDNRTIRVIGSPQSNGGLVWMFENLTEKMDLESRYNAAIRVQGETLDNLVEGAAVFGLDGKLKLFNPAFLKLWELESSDLSTETHISFIRDRCKNIAYESVWETLVEDVTGCDYFEKDRQGQTKLKNGKVLRYRLIHLPNGQIMITCVDVTDSMNIERALKEKNEALQKADELKNNFIQHVSYELRSLLTNIIGFSDLMGESQTGKLNKRQKEYLQHISSSSSALRTIIDDILDLATIDAGIMQLHVCEVDIKETLLASMGFVKKRAEEKQITLEIDTDNIPEKFFADPTRLRQVLYNLLGNAVNYAPDSSVVKLACKKTKEGVIFLIHDNGPGIPDEVVETVFKRFESRKAGGQRPGAGLGLAIVKGFVELHGGSVNIETAAGKGTTVVCFFPDFSSTNLRILEETVFDKVENDG